MTESRALSAEDEPQAAPPSVLPRPGCIVPWLDHATILHGLSEALAEPAVWDGDHLDRIQLDRREVEMIVEALAAFQPGVSKCFTGAVSEAKHALKPFLETPAPSEHPNPTTGAAP